jgi:hypothetical protein
MNENKHDGAKIVWLNWARLRLQCFEAENLLVRSEGMWPCLYGLNTTAVENTVEVDHQPSWLTRIFEEMNAELFYVERKSHVDGDKNHNINFHWPKRKVITLSVHL